MNTEPNPTLADVVPPQIARPLPVLRDMHGQVIREFDILRVFHFFGRRCGKGRKKHYMHKIAVVKDHKNPKYPKVWWFHHTAEMGEGLKNGYIPYNGSGDQWAADQTLPGVEVIDSPATLRDENEKRRIPHAQRFSADTAGVASRPATDSIPPLSAAPSSGGHHTRLRP